MRNGWNWKYPLSYMYPAHTQLLAKWSSPSIGDRRATGCMVAWEDYFILNWYLLSYLGGVGGWRKQRDDRALPRSEAPFTNFSVYSRTSQLGQFLTILCLKIAFLHLKFYTTESSFLLKVRLNGPKWIVEAKNPGLQIYAMRHILYIAIPLRVFEKKTEPTDVCSANAQSDAWEHLQTPFFKNPYNNQNLNSKFSSFGGF